MLRCWKGTIGFKITARPTIHSNMTVWTDASHAITKDRKCITGMMLQTVRVLTSWASKKQPLVGDSITDTEIMAAAFCVREAMCMRNLLADLGFDQFNYVLKVDNQLQLSYFQKESLASTDMKHIDITFQFVREQIKLGFVTQEYVCGKKKVADMLIKPLPADSFNRFRTCMGIMD